MSEPVGSPEELMQALRDARAGDSSMSVPTGVPDSLSQHNAKGAGEEMPPHKDPIGGGAMPGEQPGAAVVVNVTWDATVGQLVIWYSDGKINYIPFSDCPE